LKHFAAPSFWDCYNDLPPEIQRAARRQYQLLKNNPGHPSLRFKPVGKYWSARINQSYRALSVKGNDAYIWFWAGTHDQYLTLVRRR